MRAHSWRLQRANASRPSHQTCIAILQRSGGFAGGTSAAVSMRCCQKSLAPAGPLWAGESPCREFLAVFHSRSMSWLRVSCGVSWVHATGGGETHVFDATPRRRHVRPQRCCSVRLTGAVKFVTRRQLCANNLDPVSRPASVDRPFPTATPMHPSIRHCLKHAER